MAEAEREDLVAPGALGTALRHARERGDEDEYWRLMRQVDVPAHTLMALKNTVGAQWIRDRGLRTHLADAEYGAGWMERDGWE